MIERQRKIEFPSVSTTTLSYITYGTILLLSTVLFCYLLCYVVLWGVMLCCAVSWCMVMICCSVLFGDTVCCVMP